MAPKTDVIEQLRERVRELEEENARLKAAVEYAETIRVENIAYFEKQLAASQAYAEQLREALKRIGYDEACFEASENPSEWPVNVALEALAQPNDTSAFDAYVANQREAAYQEARKAADQLEKGLTRQRDLAVEALEKQGHSAGCRKNAFGDICTCGLDDLLSTIKESEAMAQGEKK